MPVAASAAMAIDVRAVVGFPRERERVKESLKRRLSEAPLPLMGPDLVEPAHPEIEVDLKVIDRGVDLLAEGDAVELIEHGFVEALDDAVIRYELRRRLAVRLFPERETAIW